MLDAATADVARLTDELRTAEETAAGAQRRVAHAEEQIESIAKEKATRDAALQRRETELAQLKEQLSTLTRATRQEEQQAKARAVRIRSLEAELGERDRLLGRQTRELERLAEETAGDRAATDALLAAATHEVATLTAALAVAKQEQAALASQFAELGEQVESQARELERARVLAADATRASEAEAVAHEVALVARTAELEKARQELAAAHAEVACLLTRTQELEENANTAATDLASARDTIATLRGAITERVKQEEVLQALVEELSRRRWPWSPLPEGASRPETAKRARRRRRATAETIAPRPSGRRFRTTSQLASWFVRPQHGWRFFGTFLALRRTDAFDPFFYLERYPDVAALGLNPLLHYIEHGAWEGRDPRVDFRTDDYLDAHPELPDRRENPLLHSLRRPVAPLEQPAAVVDPAESETAPKAPHASIVPALPAARAASTASREPTRAAAYTIVPGERPIYDDFIVLLARQRSGTNPLRSVLETHPDIFCFNEVFNFADKDSEDELLREANYFSFLERYGGGDVTRTFPDHSERLFLDYLEYLRCLAPKKFKVIDVKYNTAHFLTDQWPRTLGVPYLFELIQRHELRVLHLLRRNYLRYVVSTEKAWITDRYSSLDGKGAYSDIAIPIDPQHVLEELERCAREDRLVTEALTGYENLLTGEYAEIFSDGTLRKGFLDQVAEWLGVRAQFRDEPRFTKQSTLPLRETIENFDDVANVLRGTDFEYVIDDEPEYGATAPPGPAPSAPAGASVDWPSIIGEEPDAFVASLCHARPDWISGSLSHDDAKFLFKEASNAGVAPAVEIGTASGFSTLVLTHALHHAHRAGLVGSNWRVASYDIDDRLYFDRSKRVGDAAREQLPAELLERIDFRSPTTAADLRRVYGRDSIGFMFIDANHQHPWPTLDLLAALHLLRTGATVVLHDINLPIIHPQFAAWGVKYLFDDLKVEKTTSADHPPNTGSIRIPADKSAFRRQLLAIVERHEWEVAVDDAVVAAAIDTPST
ncbi:MAG TPA: class I SAM-dependent methyltransferase [Gaiellaceae bacterium]|nr:class I SAM-dependent methyltransferase [Gaiellaceae bacterium]